MTKAILKALFTLAFLVGTLVFLTKLKIDATDRSYVKVRKEKQELPENVKKKVQEEFENLDE